MSLMQSAHTASWLGLAYPGQEGFANNTKIMFMEYEMFKRDWNW